jgi:outer membrane protein TolC
MRKTLAFLVLGAPLAAETLSIEQAVRLAVAKHPSVEASRSGVKAAETRITQARSGYLPKVNYSESFLRTNNPVAVFSSLLTQHRFTQEDFLNVNRPDALNNFQSQLAVDQVLYDAGQTRHATRSAHLGREISAEDERKTTQQAIANVVRAYYGAVVSEQALNVADEAVRSAEADLNRAEAIRAAGMSTDADVLSIKVHHAAMREQQIRRRADLDVARAALNEALGLPLTDAHQLTTPLNAVSIENLPLEEYEKESLRSRPEIRQARFASSLAATQGAMARGSYLPQVIVHAAFEADRQRFVTRGGANWLASVQLRWNLFNGFADRARADEAQYGLLRARAQQSQAEGQIRLHVRQAHANFQAAQQRIEVAQAAVSMAEESLRITKNRFESGLGNVTDLLRNETALLDARTRRLAAVYDQRLAAVQLALAAGTLSADSKVLN